MVGTGPTKPPTDKFDKQVANIIGEVWPIAAGTKYICSTADQIKKVQGYKDGQVDASLKFAIKGTSKAVFKGAMATWTCSGAEMLLTGVMTAGMAVVYGI